MCIERNGRKNHDVDIRSSPMTSMERKNFDVVRWLFLMVKFSFLLTKSLRLLILLFFLLFPVSFLFPSDQRNKLSQEPNLCLFPFSLFLLLYSLILFPFYTTKHISRNDINSLWQKEFQHNKSYFDNDLYSSINRISTIYITDICLINQRKYHYY